MTKLVTFPGAYHEVFNDLGRDRRGSRRRHGSTSCSRAEVGRSLAAKALEPSGAGVVFLASFRSSRGAVTVVGGGNLEVALEARAQREQPSHRFLPALGIRARATRAVLRREHAFDAPRRVEFALRAPQSHAETGEQPGAHGRVSINAAGGRERRAHRPDNCMSSAFAVAPPSTFEDLHTRVPASRAIASTMSLRLWNASDSRAARAMWARVVPRVSPNRRRARRDAVRLPRPV